MEKVTNELQKPSNFATMFEAKVQKVVVEAEAKEEAANNKGESHKKDIHGNEIRKRNTKQLHSLMDVQIQQKQSRLHYAAITN